MSFPNSTPVNLSPRAVAAAQALTITAVAIEAIAAGAPVAMINNGGTENFEESDASVGPTRHRCAGVAPNAILIGASGEAISFGLVEIPAARWTGGVATAANIGQRVFVSALQGLVSLTPAETKIEIGQVFSGSPITVLVNVLQAGLATVALFSATDANLPAAAPAAAVVRNEHPLLAYDADVIENAEFNATYPSWTQPDPAGIVSVSLGLLWVAAPAVVVGDVKWNAQLETLAPGGQDLDVDGFAAAQTTTTTTSGTNGVPVLTTIDFNLANADTPLPLAGFRLRVTRDATNVLDTMLGDAQLLSAALRQTIPGEL